MVYFAVFLFLLIFFFVLVYKYSLFFFRDSRARAKSASGHARSHVLLAFVSLRKQGTWFTIDLVADMATLHD